jgi:hypothetical protein
VNAPLQLESAADSPQTGQAFLPWGGTESDCLAKIKTTLCNERSVCHRCQSKSSWSARAEGISISQHR